MVISEEKREKLEKRFSNNSSYRERLNLLLDNPELGKEEIEGEQVVWPEKYPPVDESNCYGTTAYLLDLEKEITETWSEFVSIYSDSDFFDNILSLPTESDRPGYVGSMTMREFLFNSDKSEKTDREDLDLGVMILYDERYKDRGFWRVVHTVVYDDLVGKDEFVIHQKGRG